MIGGWVVAHWGLRKAMQYTPFMHCSGCRRAIPRLASYCSFCGMAHKLLLLCWSCGTPVTKWSRKCLSCHVRTHFPWHLQVRRLMDLYPAAVPCPALPARKKSPQG
jgi:predicted amidophosphoribosyltransferase